MKKIHHLTNKYIDIYYMDKKKKSIVDKKKKLKVDKNKRTIKTKNENNNTNNNVIHINIGSSKLLKKIGNQV